MHFESIALLTAALFGYGLISKPAEERGLTGPMFFTALGALMFSLGVPGFSADHDGDHPLGTPEWVHTLAEVALALILFVDASHVSPKELWADRVWIGRLLGVGLPITIALGAVAGLLLCSEVTVIEAMLIAAMLAPTDAALGLAVVTNPGVPLKIRQALIVESGLNDGIVLPLVVALGCFAATQAGFSAAETHEGLGWLGFGAAQGLGGPALGLAVGWIGGKAVERCASAPASMTPGFQRLAAPALAWFAFAAAEGLGANGFLAAFTAGLAVGATTDRGRKALQGYGEATGELLALLTFAGFGAFLVPSLFSEFQLNRLGMALFALTVMRMAPVSFALGRTADRRTRLFIGWFGPRGIASILFLLLIGDRLSHPQAVSQVVAWTVLLSIFAHGMTSGPLARSYARASA